jgi:hypothetical protein
MSRPHSRSVRTLVRTSLRSRLEAECLGRAYELAVPMLQRRVADVSACPLHPKLRSFTVPQQRVGG